MKTTGWTIVVTILLVIIIALAWILITSPASVHTPAVFSNATTSVPKDQKPQLPLSESVQVQTPGAGATVENTFTIAGSAPNSWYSEAVFPIQVRDVSDNVIGRGQGHAQSDWTIPGAVVFTSSITLDGIYKGAATLILMRDNPSGLPQNDDSVTIPIIVK